MSVGGGTDGGVGGALYGQLNKLLSVVFFRGKCRYEETLKKTNKQTKTAHIHGSRLLEVTACVCALPFVPAKSPLGVI